MTESVPSTSETIHLLNGKVWQFFPKSFFKIKKQEEEVEAIREESRREIIFISWKFKCMLSLHNPHKNIVLRHQPLCTDDEVLQPNIPYPAALTNNLPISAAKNTAGQFSCSCYVSIASEIGTLFYAALSPALSLREAPSLCMHDGGSRQKETRRIIMLTLKPSAQK